MPFTSTRRSAVLTPFRGTLGGARCAALCGLCSLLVAHGAVHGYQDIAKPSAPPTVPPTAPPVASPPATGPTGQPVLPPGTRVVPSESYADDPRLEVVRRMLGDQQYVQARVVGEAVLKEHPGLGRAEFFLGLALSKMKQYEQSRPHFEAAIKTGDPFPERKHAHHFMAWASYHLGELDRAKAEFEAHVALVGDEPDSIFALGIIAFDEDRLDEAEARFKKSIELQSGPTASKRDVAKAWARLGDISMRLDDPAKAEDQFMKSLALYPDHYEVWSKLARSRDRLGKAREAVSAREEEKKARERVGLRPTESDDIKPATLQPAPSGPQTPAPNAPLAPGSTSPAPSPTPKL